MRHGPEWAAAFCTVYPIPIAVIVMVLVTFEKGWFRGSWAWVMSEPTWKSTRVIVFQIVRNGLFALSMADLIWDYRSTQEIVVGALIGVVLVTGSVQAVHGRNRSLRTLPSRDEWLGVLTALLMFGGAIAMVAN